MHKKDDGFRWQKDKCEGGIYKGHWVSDNNTLIKQTCPECKQLFGYFSNSGKPIPERRGSKCPDCIQQSIIDACREGHTMRLSVN